MRSKLFKVLAILGIVTFLTGFAALAAMSVTAEETAGRVYSPPKNALAQLQEQYARDSLIRFHVIANSDSERDQALKRKIRDLVVARVTPELAKARNIDEARKIAGENLGVIEDTARQEIAAWGEEYQVKAQLGKFNFPVKSYGDLTLPAGNYEAVRVVIGQGQGANWWCVLFPPLCFVDVSKAMGPVDPVPAQVSQNKEFKVKFKLLEIFGL